MALDSSQSTTHSSRPQSNPSERPPNDILALSLGRQPSARRIRLPTSPGMPIRATRRGKQQAGSSLHPAVRPSTGEATGLHAIQGHHHTPLITGSSSPGGPSTARPGQREGKEQPLPSPAWKSLNSSELKRLKAVHAVAMDLPKHLIKHANRMYGEDEANHGSVDHAVRNMAKNPFILGQTKKRAREHLQRTHPNEPIPHSLLADWDKNSEVTTVRTSHGSTTRAIKHEEQPDEQERRDADFKRWLRHAHDTPPTSAIDHTEPTSSMVVPQPILASLAEREEINLRLGKTLAPAQSPAKKAKTSDTTDKGKDVVPPSSTESSSS